MEGDVINEVVFFKVKELAKDQGEAGKCIVNGVTHDLKGLSDISDLAGKIFDKATDGLFLFNKHCTGSWIAGNFMPLQLITNSKLLVDLTEAELIKEKPFNIPLNSLKKLLDLNYLYVNIRDVGDFTENEAIFAGRAAENLAKIMEVAKGRIYIGNALRAPLFNFMIEKSGRKDITYECYKNFFLDKLKNAYKAFEERIIEDKIFKRLSEFRGEKVAFIAPAWHYAFLESAREKLPKPIKIFFETKNKEIESQSKIVRTIIELEQDSEKWICNKSNHDLLVRISNTYLDLISKLRLFHLASTASITGSWGSTYNRTQEEYFHTTKLYAENIFRDIRNSPEYNEFILSLLIEEKYMNNESLSDFITATPNFSLNKQEIEEGDERFIDSLIEFREKNNKLISELNEMAVDVNKKYLHNYFSVEDCRKIYRDHSSNYKSYMNSVVKWGKSISNDLDVNLAFGIPTIMIGINVASQLQKIPDFFRQVLCPTAEHRVAYELKKIIKQKKKKKGSI